jgi:hypothetical protein
LQKNKIEAEEMTKPIITIFYNDCENRVSKIVGALIETTPTSYTIKMGNKIITVPLGKIVRIEQDD